MPGTIAAIAGGLTRSSLAARRDIFQPAVPAGPSYGQIPPHAIKPVLAKSPSGWFQGHPTQEYAEVARIGDFSICRGLSRIEDVEDDLGFHY